MGEYDREWKKYIFGQIHMLMFVVVVIFTLFSIFGQIHPYLGQVRRLMLVGGSFGHVPILTFISVKFFWSNPNRFFVLSIWSSEQDSVIIVQKFSGSGLATSLTTFQISLLLL